MENYFKKLASDNGPVLITGPCSVESESQLNTTIDQIVSVSKPSIIRGGIWKPRTRPGGFEGIGIAGLKWLKDVGEKHGLPVTTEVANAGHVEQALKAGIDILWIGARTTVNPFQVQEIADALKGTNIPVMVKNPVSPDLGLWLGAIERLKDAGVSSLAAIHRGFTHYGTNKYRNEPNWEIPVRFMVEHHDVPMFCDPSHIAGKKELVLEVSQKALDLGMAGLMIESHNNPSVALSDNAQQIPSSDLGKLLNELIVRTNVFEDESFQSRLEKLRSIIDEMDSKLLEHLSARMDIVQEIGNYKRENNVTIFQIDRWEEILETRSSWARERGLDVEMIRDILHDIHKASINMQNDIFTK